MSRTVTIAVSVAALFVLGVLFSCVYTIYQTQQALVLRLGKPERIINAYDARSPFGMGGAGLALKVPFIENVVFIDKRVLDLDMPVLNGLGMCLVSTPQGLMTNREAKERMTGGRLVLYVY